MSAFAELAPAMHDAWRGRSFLGVKALQLFGSHRVDLLLLEAFPIKASDNPEVAAAIRGKRPEIMPASRPASAAFVPQRLLTNSELEGLNGTQVRITKDDACAKEK